MRFGRVCLVEDDPALRITSEPSEGNCLYDVRVKSVDTGEIYTGDLIEPMSFANGDYIKVPSKDMGRVVFRATPVVIDFVATWFESPEQVSFADWQATMAEPEKVSEDTATEDIAEEVTQTTEVEPDPYSIEQGILDVLRKDGPLAVKDITVKLGMREWSNTDQNKVRSTLNDLLADGLVRKGEMDRAGGRPTQLWEAVA